jgi:hypothetical protein
MRWKPLEVHSLRKGSAQHLLQAAAVRAPSNLRLGQNAMQATFLSGFQGDFLITPRTSEIMIRLQSHMSTIYSTTGMNQLSICGFFEAVSFV